MGNLLRDKQFSQILYGHKQSLIVAIIIRPIRLMKIRGISFFIK